MKIAVPTDNRQTITKETGKAKEFAIYELNDVKIQNVNYIENAQTNSEIIKHLNGVDYFLVAELEIFLRNDLQKENIKFQYTNQTNLDDIIFHFTYHNSLVQSLINIEHPFISFPLTELGILQDIDIDMAKKNVSVMFVFPFPEIPIADQLINLVKTPVSELEFKFEYEIRVMNDEEKQIFLQLETQGWKGK